MSSIDPATLACADPSLHVDALIGFNVVPKMSTSERSLDDLTPLLDRAVEVADERGGRQEQAWARCMLAYVARSRGEISRARGLMQDALARYEEIHSPFGLTYVHYELGWVDMTAGEVGGAARHFRAALAFSEGLTGYDVLSRPPGPVWRWPMPPRVEPMRLWPAPERRSNRPGLCRCRPIW